MVIGMKIKKAVIPAAGLGVRMLPASKAVPKEMLPIVDKPAIQYIVEEAVRSGIQDILIVTSRGKAVIEDHFDRSPELEERLLHSGREDEVREMREIHSMANIVYMRQKEILGLGHAVLCAQSFVGGEPFAVLYADDVILGDNPACGQLCAAYDEFGLGVAGIRQVSPRDITRYSSLKLRPVRERIYDILDMIEKPAPGQEFSLYSILGRCVLPPEIFGILERTPKGAGGEYQLTDAMATLARESGMVGVEYEGLRYDMGSKLGFLAANVETALRHPVLGAEFRQYLTEYGKHLL